MFNYIIIGQIHVTKTEIEYSNYTTQRIENTVREYTTQNKIYQNINDILIFHNNEQSKLDYHVCI